MPKTYSTPLNTNKETTVVYKTDGSPMIEMAQVEVIVIKGKDEGHSSVLEQSGFVVGTDPSANLRLTDPSVSRRHVELSLDSNGIRVRDLDSTNGTKVGRKRITDGVVDVGTTLVLAETRIELRRMVERYPLPISRRRRFGDLVGNSAAMRQVYALLERAAEVDATVLLEGATGTGKDLAARALHEHSNRAPNQMVIVDCGAVSPTLIEAELFGHEKGAFTSADRERAGAFEQANKGTLFFDEIGELPLSLQPKLLRALESREIQRIGASTRIPVDVRFVAATNRNLKKEVDAGRFREDLYYRLNVFKITMPSLSEHPSDIPLLVKHFLGAHGDATLSGEILQRMVQLDWPGNVRELRNAVERAVILSQRHPPSFPPNNSGQPVFSEIDLDTNKPFKELKAELIDSFEKRYLSEVIRRNKGNISASARQSGIDRKHLERLVRKHSIEVRGKKK
jgi:DNA-binding NtrC family response regulator